MTYDIVRHQKIVKRYGTINFNSKTCVGELKITRCVIKSISPITGDVRNCEIDVIYKGTINDWGRWMGPTREVSLDSRYTRHWMSTIRRNREFRRQVRDEVISYLKYLGVYIPYKHNLTIRKIVWKESGI